VVTERVIRLCASSAKRGSARQAIDLLTPHTECAIAVLSGGFEAAIAATHTSRRVKLTVQQLISAHLFRNEIVESLFGGVAVCYGGCSEYSTSFSEKFTSVTFRTPAYTGWNPKRDRNMLSYRDISLRFRPLHFDIGRATHSDLIAISVFAIHRERGLLGDSDTNPKCLLTRVEMKSHRTSVQPIRTVHRSATVVFKKSLVVSSMQQMIGTPNRKRNVGTSMSTGRYPMFQSPMTDRSVAVGGPLYCEVTVPSGFRHCQFQ